MNDRYSAQGPGGTLTGDHVDPGLKTVACMALLALALSATSQPWCIPGAQWWHTYNDGSGTVGYAHSAYEADTLINGVTWCRITAQVDAWNVPFQTP